MDYRIYELPEAAHYYPSPRVSMLPVLEANSLSLSSDNPDQSRFLREDTHFVTSGRMALYYALQLIGIAAEDEVLLPSYHCGSMLEPVVYIGARPVFYHVTQSLKADIDQLRKCITTKTRALLLPHFFGFPQHLQFFRRLCDEHNIALIEDCAHSFYGSIEGMQVGAVGDFAIASTVKFFPGTEGGALVCNQGPIDFSDLDTNRPGVRQQIKSMVNIMETASTYNRLGALGTLLRQRSCNRPQQTAAPNGLETTSFSFRSFGDHEFHWFSPDDIGRSPTWTTRFVATHSDSKRIKETRIKNYRTLLEAFSGMKEATPLYTTLHEGVVPYVFPLVLSNPERDFPALKMLAVPMWRWEELVESSCPVSNNFRLSLIQLPCHQSLSDSELAWIITTIKNQITS